MNIRLSPRLYIDGALGRDGTMTVTDDQAHYLQHVMRLKSGDTVRVFNGSDGEWRAVIGTMTKRTINLNIEEQLRSPSTEPDIWLHCAPIKKGHFDYMVEKAVELGVAALAPVLTARTQIRDVNIERCRAMAIESSEQSERMTIPAIHEVTSLKELLAKWPSDRTLIVCAELGEAKSAHNALMGIPRDTKAAILTGPEGGFTDDEFDQLRRVPNAVFIRLGPRILRADTAAIAALTLWQGICGDWASD